MYSTDTDTQATCMKHEEHKNEDYLTGLDRVYTPICKIGLTLVPIDVWVGTRTKPFA